VFKPYSGVGTAVLVFVKGGKTEEIWFYEMMSDGYSLDDKRDFIDGKGNIPDILEKFKKGRVESSRSILVPLATVRKNDYGLSISRYKQNETEEVEYEEPEVMIDELLDLEEQIKIGLGELREIING
jgi:type I restriction enzyme M protein